MVHYKTRWKPTLLNYTLTYLKRCAHNAAHVTDDGTHHASFSQKLCFVIKQNKCINWQIQLSIIFCIINAVKYANIQKNAETV